MKYIIIGITDAPNPFFPPEVLGIIRKGKVFSGGKRHHELVAHLLPENATWIDITVPLDAVFEQYRNISCSPDFSVGGDSAAARSDITPAVIVFASGDPLFFGFANTIRHLE